MKGALGYGQAEKQAHRRRSDTKIHVSIKFYTHFPCQLVTMNYKGWFAYLAKWDHTRPVIWTPSYGQCLPLEAYANHQAKATLLAPQEFGHLSRLYRLFWSKSDQAVSSPCGSSVFKLLLFSASSSSHLLSPFIHLIPAFITPAYLDNSPFLSFNLSLEFFLPHSLISTVPAGYLWPFHM